MALSDIKEGVLNLTIGTDEDIHIYLVDENGVAESLALATSAVFSLAVVASGTPLVLRTTTAANLTINTTDNRLELTGVTAGEWATLRAGTYIADVALTLDGKNIRTDRFNVAILDGVSDTEEL